MKPEHPPGRPMLAYRAQSEPMTPVKDMKRYVALIAAATLLSSVTRAEITSIQWRDMNTDFQAAYIEGLLAAVSTFGVSNHLREPMDAGIDCLIQKKWTAPQIVQRFTTFLKQRPDLKKYPLPMAFLDYLLEVCDPPK